MKSKRAIQAQVQPVVMLPCPFCGRNPTLTQMEEGFWDISCPYSSCAESYFIRSTKALAIKAWNHRST
jgi:ribosomal protein L37AE/L43A